MKVRHLQRPAIVAVLAAACGSGRAIRVALQGSARRIAGRRVWPFLLTHFAAMGAFAGLTAAILEGTASRGSGGAHRRLVVGDRDPRVGPLRGGPPAGRPLVEGGARGVEAPGLRGRRWRPGGRRIGLDGQPVDRFHQTTFRAVAAILGLLFRDPVCDPAGLILGVGSFTVAIGSPCSGYEGIGLIWAFLAIYLGRVPPRPLVPVGPVARPDRDGHHLVG